MTRARNLAGLSTVTAQPTVTTPVHLGPLGVVTATRYYGTFDETNIISTSIATTDIQISGITTGLNVSGIITAQNGLDITGNIVNGLNVSAGIATLQALTATTGTFTGDTTFAGTVSIAGTLTYEDITDIDSVGVGTFRRGIVVSGVSTFLGNQSGVSVTGVGTFNNGLNVTGNITNGLNVSAGIATFASDVNVSGDVNIADYIVHLGDTSAKFGFPTADTFVLNTSGSEIIRIDSSGRLLVNTNASINGVKVQLVSAHSSFFGVGNNSTSTVLDLWKTRATTASTNTVLQDGDGIGEIRFRGSTSDQYVNGAVIKAVVNGTPGSGNDLPTDLTFITMPDGVGSTNERMRITSAGLVGIGTDAGAASSNSMLTLQTTGSTACRLVLANTGSTSKESTQIYSQNNDLVLNTAASERVRIDSSGRVLIGATSARLMKGSNQYQALLVEGLAAASSARISLVRNSNDDSYPEFLFGKSRGTSDGSNTVVQSGDGIGALTFLGADGDDMNSRAASIECYVDGTPGNADMPARLVLSTTADGAAAPTERVRIDKNGQLVLSNGSMSTAYGNSICGGTNLELDTSGIIKFRTDTNQRASITDNGLCFGSDSAAANALDDYEEGTWTPTAGTLSSPNLSGEYTKIGRLVFIKAFIGWGSHSNSGNITIGGLPFTPSGAGYAYIGDSRFINLDSNMYSVGIYMDSSGVVFRENGDNQGAAALTWSQVGNDTYFGFAGFYKVA